MKKINRKKGEFLCLQSPNCSNTNYSQHSHKKKIIRKSLLFKIVAVLSNLGFFHEKLTKKVFFLFFFFFLKKTLFQHQKLRVKVVSKFKQKKKQSRKIERYGENSDSPLVLVSFCLLISLGFDPWLVYFSPSLLCCQCYVYKLFSCHLCEDSIPHQLG